jgi:hypothetical protein
VPRDGRLAGEVEMSGEVRRGGDGKSLVTHDWTPGLGFQPVDFGIAIGVVQAVDGS